MIFVGRFPEKLGPHGPQLQGAHNSADRGEMTPVAYLFSAIYWGPLYKSICNDRLETPML